MLEAVRVTNGVSMLNKRTVDWGLDSWVMEVPLMQVTVGVGGFLVNAVVECPVWISGDENIKKGYLSGMFLLLW